MIILTQKGVLVHSTENNIIIQDPIGNKISHDEKEENHLDVLGKYGLYPIFIIDETSLETCENKLNDETTSLILKTEETFLTFMEWVEIIMPKIRQIEWTSSQIIFGKTFLPNEVALWNHFSQQEISIRDCKCDSSFYEKFISHWSKELPELTKSFQTQYEITRLIEVVRFEMSHAEARLREAINWVINIVKVVHESDHLEKGSEFVKYGINVDQIGWCITDTVKSLSTALDALSKYISVNSNAMPNKIPKTPAALAGHIQNYKPKGDLIPKDRYSKIQDAFSKVKSLINLRHELTHNQALYPVRQPAFVGYATPCVNDENIAYGEIMWWDRDGDHFSRSNGRTGFFKEKRNAIIEATEAFRNTCELIDLILDTVRLEVFCSARKNNINEICFLNSTEKDKHRFICVSIERLINNK